MASSNSPAVSQDARLHLPYTVDPPGPDNPPSQKVWVVSCPSLDTLTQSPCSHPTPYTLTGLWSHRPHGSKYSQSMHLTQRQSHSRRPHWREHAYPDARMARRAQFETNFFGTLNIIQLSLPYFREQQNGRYLIFSSTSGALGVPGLGPYCATKYAVEGLIESMLYEVDAFNIKATLVAPGHLRLDEPTGLDEHATDGSGAMGELPTYGHFFVKPPSQPYESQNAPAAHAKRVVQWLSRQQPTSAVKSAELTWQLGHCSFPPLRLLLGSFAVESIRDRLCCIIEEIEDWKHLSFVTAEEEAKAKDADNSETGQPQSQDQPTPGSVKEQTTSPTTHLTEQPDDQDMDLDDG